MKIDDAVSRAAQALQRALCRDGLPTLRDTTGIAIDAMLRLHGEEVEVALGYWLDHDLRLLGSDEIARGTELSVSISPRHLVRAAIKRDASIAVVAHNHPNADATPSDADKRTADSIDRGLAAIGVVCAAHYVVARDGIADIRTGQITRLADLAGQSNEPPSGPRCPHCHGAL